MTKDEALKLALEAFEAPSPMGQYKAITAIKEALAQTQEPFAYVNIEKRKLEFAHDYVKWDTPTTVKLERIPLYTAPPQRKPLTDEEIDELWESTASYYNTHDFARAIEAKLKQKNGYAEE